MRKIESFILGVLLGAVPVLFCFVTAWFTSALLLDDERIVAIVALSGLGVGIILDVVFLKRWVRNAYRMSNKVLAAIYIFYSVGAVGFCMGLPILNIGLGIVAGLYVARKMYHDKTDEQQRSHTIRRTAVFCAKVMVFVCSLIALWAAVGGMIGAEIVTPLLSFTMTVPVFIAIVLTGGLTLVLLQYWLTGKSAKSASRLWR